MPDEFRGRRAIHFIDNTSALSGLIKGYSSVVDSGKIVTAQSAVLGAHTAGAARRD